MERKPLTLTCVAFIILGIGSSTTVSPGHLMYGGISRISVTQRSGPVDDPVMHWPMDEGEGELVLDAGQHHNDGVLMCSGDGCTLPTWTQGLADLALQFDGDGYLRIPNHASIQDHEVGSVAFWFKVPRDFTPQSHEANQSLFNYGRDINHLLNVQMNANNGTLTVFLRKSNSQSWPFSWTMSTSKTSWKRDTWFHIAIVQDGTSPQLYLNGAAHEGKRLHSTDESQRHWLASVANLPRMKFFVGIRFGKEGFFKGLIDDLRIYRYPLSEADVKQLYDEYSPE